MSIHKTFQIQLRLSNGILTLAVVADQDPVQIEFRYKQKTIEGESSSDYSTLNPDPKYLQKGIERALATSRINENTLELVPIVLKAAQQLLEIVQIIQPKDLIERFPQMEAELDAWHTIVKEFKALDQDINDSRFNPLVDAIRHWAEYLVALRIEQTSEERNKAMQLAVRSGSATKITNGKQ